MKTSTQRLVVSQTLRVRYAHSRKITLNYDTKLLGTLTVNPPFFDSIQSSEPFSNKSCILNFILFSLSKSPQPPNHKLNRPNLLVVLFGCLNSYLRLVHTVELLGNIRCHNNGIKLFLCCNHTRFEICNTMSHSDGI